MVSLDESTGKYYVELTRAEVEQAIKEAGKTSLSNKRLYVAAVDYARGRTGALVHFSNADDYVNYTMLQGYGLSINNDFKYDASGLKLIEKDLSGDEVEVSLLDGGLVSTSTGTSLDISEQQEENLGFFAKIFKSIREFFQKLFSGKLFGGK